MALIKPKSSGIDTSDATATANDIITGLTAYGANGKITGNIPYEKNFSAPEKFVNISYFKQGFLALTYLGSKRVVENIGMTITGNRLGDATPEDVASGKTFTSTSGLKVTGTATIGGGTDTSDATVTAADVINGVTAYGADGKITGTMPSYNGYVFSTTKTPEMIDDYIKITTDAPIQNKMAISGNISGNAPASTFGNASASDVAEGKTFTSTAGVAVTGTAKMIETVPVTIKKTGSGESALIWWTDENGRNQNSWNSYEETTINVVKNTAIFFSGTLVSSVSGTVDKFVKSDCSIVFVESTPVTILIP